MILEKYTKYKRPSKSCLYEILCEDINNELKKNKKINFIDFACGNAKLLKKFNFKSYTGVDLDKKKF
jgi:5-methylcytosine-specific restriction endonuclease McrBC GTP-binding regulatory subunit McrB